MVSQRHQLRADEPLLGDQLDFRGVSQQLGSDQDDDVVNVFTAVARRVLSIHEGVDRHLSHAASTNGVDEVDGGPAPL